MAAFLSWACDQTFEPVASGGEGLFSIFGYLDASADTQWIRVMPIRSLKATSQGSFAAVVTLENLGTGQVIQLRDSLVELSSYSGPDLGFGTAYVHDFWTTDRIEPGATYRFSARQDSQEAAEAVVSIPLDYQVELWLAPPPPPLVGWRDPDYLRIAGVKHLPFAVQIAHFIDDCGVGVDSVWYERYAGPDGTFVIPISTAEVQSRGEPCGRPGAVKRELWVVGSDSIWPAGGGYSVGGLGRSVLESNITNAIGFIGGVLTKTVPYDACELRSMSGDRVDSYCELRYDAQSATMRGTVSETRCGDGPIAEVTVEMTRLEQTPSEVRTYHTGVDGAFEIGALPPETPYALDVRAPQISIGGGLFIDAYTTHSDTLTFAAGERRLYDVGLRRLVPCDQKPWAR